MERYVHILGSLYGAAIGDAMGAATETMSPRMIRERFGSYVEQLLPAPSGTFLCGCPAGHVTDDFSLAYYTAKGLVRCGGQVTQTVAEDILTTWYGDDRYARFAGPSTGRAIRRILGEETEPAAIELACDNSAATNGGAMKIFPAGLIHPGDPDAAVRDAVTLCLPTHNNAASLAGACAVAAATAAACTGADIAKVLDAGLYGAHMGAAYGREVSTASVEERMKVAIELGRTGGNTEETMLRIGSLIGAGLAANEAVPAVFGILAATGGNAMDAIRMGVNIGNDTDTVATMCGAIAGAMSGPDAFPEDMKRTVERVNKMDFETLARELAEAYPGE